MGRMFALHEVPDVRDVGDPRASPDLNRYAAREHHTPPRAG